MEAELKLALEEACLEAGVNLTEVLNPTALFLMGDPNPLPTYELPRWLASTRRRTAMPRSSSFSIKGTSESVAKLNLELRNRGLESSHSSLVETESSLTAPSSSADEALLGTNFRKRVSKAIELHINSTEFCWETLVSLHHTEHTASSKGTEAEMTKPQENSTVPYVTCNMDSPYRRPDKRPMIQEALNQLEQEVQRLREENERRRLQEEQGFLSQILLEEERFQQELLQRQREAEEASEEGQKTRSEVHGRAIAAASATTRVEAVDKIVKSTPVVTEEGAWNWSRVTVNSGGVVYFALFKLNSPCETNSGEGAAVLKFTPSRLTTQSERLGFELARQLGVPTPESRVIHKGTSEWVQIQAAAERCLSVAREDDNEVLEATFKGFLEALNLSSCLLLMGYIHGYPIVESVDSFQIQEIAERTAAALGRVFVLDLVLRNEDRLPCHQLGWRGNPANLLCTEKPPLAHLMHHIGFEHSKTSSKTAKTRKGTCLIKEQKARSFDRNLSAFQTADSFLQKTCLQDGETVIERKKSTLSEFHIVAIDSGVPRRPPSGKRESDQLRYPQLVELLLNISSFAANLLFEISWSNLGFPQLEEASRMEKNQCPDFLSIEKSQVTHAFQRGFRGGIRDMQNLHVFLLKLYRRLDTLLRKFISAISRTLPTEKEEHGMNGDESRHSRQELMSRGDSPLLHQHSHQVKQEGVETSKEQAEVVNTGFERGRVGSSILSEQDEIVISSFDPGTVRSDEKDCSSVKHHCQLSKRLTLKLKGVNRTAKVDAELNAELNYWNEVLCREGQEICREKGFVTGFLEGGGSHSVVDCYELKVRLEHVLERMTLILKGANTERPSCVLENLYIGGALAGRSVNTLQCIGITHILCLCPSEIEPPEDYLKIFEYKSFQVLDLEEADISTILEDACDFIEIVEKTRGKALVHCFEGKSRSSMVVLAYLMMRKNQNLLQAWTQLKAVHHRAQPNDGFMRTLVALDKQLHGKVSMDWRQKKPVIQTCPICGRSAGINNCSLKNHLQRSHPGANETDIGDSRKQSISHIEKSVLDTQCSSSLC